MWSWTLFASLLAAATTVRATHPTRITYEVVTGVFKQDDNGTVAGSFNFTAENFGLIERAYPSDRYAGRNKSSWQRLNRYIDSLNDKARRNERYALLFLGRHGEGYHNAAESYFGTPAWNCYWSELDGNSTVTWADAHLTPKGIQQAQDVHRFWAKLLAVDRIAAPQSYYTSPLYRCLDTARLTFSGLPLPRGSSAFRPTIKEYFREGVSAHTCDRRSNKTYIRANFPTFRFERGFAQSDPLWTPLFAETAPTQDVRSKKVLDDVFSNDDSTYISVTAHSGQIASLLRVLGHRVFGLATGAAMPVLVKVTTVKGEGLPSSTQPYAPQKTCAVPPAIRDSSCNDCSCCS